MITGPDSAIGMTGRPSSESLEAPGGKVNIASKTDEAFERMGLCVRNRISSEEISIMSASVASNTGEVDKEAMIER